MYTLVSETAKREQERKGPNPRGCHTVELRSKLGVNSRIEAGLNAGASVSGMVDGVAAITCPCQHRVQTRYKKPDVASHLPDHAE